MHLAQTDLKLSNSGFDLGHLSIPHSKVVVYDEILVVYKRCFDSLNDIIHSEMKLLSSVDSTYHLEFLLANAMGSCASDM